MRRPQQEPLQNNHEDHHNNLHIHHESSVSSSRSHQINEKEESRLARVKRVLSASFLGRASCTGTSTRVFGVQLDLLDTYLDTGVPYIVHRLCTYIEAYGFQNPSTFRLTGSSARIAERLKVAFERRGDADFENSSCPASAAALLRLYLKELPQPLVPLSMVSRLLQIHCQDHGNNRESWIIKTKELLSALSMSHRRLLGYLTVYFSRFESQHGCGAGICGIFAPVMLPHVPPATILLRDMLHDAHSIFPDCVRDTTVNVVISSSDCKVCKDLKDESFQSYDTTTLICPSKPSIKRKDPLDFCNSETKLIRSNSEERILEKANKAAETIRRVSSHEDFKSEKHQYVSKVQQDMGQGVRCGLPLHERTNVSPVLTKQAPLSSSCDVVVASEKFDCDAERVRSSERFSRSVAPRGRWQARRRKVHKGLNIEKISSKGNEENAENIYNMSPGQNVSEGQSFLEMLSSGPSRSPSPARPPLIETEDSNNPALTNWGFQHRQGNEDDNIARVEAMVSPRNSILIPRRFYSEDDPEEHPIVTNTNEFGLKNLVKHINSLKKKIRKYEGQFEENFGYRPNHLDKMSNRDVKRICSELNKVRKEHKMLKEGLLGAVQGVNRNRMIKDVDGNMNNNNNGQDATRNTSMEEVVKEIERKLSEKQGKSSSLDNLEDLSYEELLEKKTDLQKALLHIENTFGRPVSKEDRAILRPLYDNYRTLKRLLIRAGANRNKDSLSELATILEHEAMDFTSSSLPGNSYDGERRASEPDMSHRGILDCIDSMDQIPTDSDSQHSNSDGSRVLGESLHSMPQNELVVQQQTRREEKKRLRRTLKELEAEFEARAGRRMMKEDREPHVIAIYENYKQTKAELRLIDALLAKNA